MSRRARSRIFRKNSVSHSSLSKRLPSTSSVENLRFATEGKEPGHQNIPKVLSKSATTNSPHPSTKNADPISYPYYSLRSSSRLLMHRTMVDSNHLLGSSLALTPTTESSQVPPELPYSARVAYRRDSSSPAQTNLEPMRMVVSQDRSPVPRVPFMPILDMDVAEFIEAPPQFFLATPAEVLLQKGVSQFGQDQRERLEQFRSIERGTCTATGIGGEDDSVRSFPYYHQATFCDAYARGSPDENLDGMIDEEVAIASARASERRTGSSLATKFSLRPRPLRKDDTSNPDFFFRD